MNIADKFKQKSLVYSFEVFPPKKNMPIETIYETLDGLKDLGPDFISVTYGAGGNLADHATCDIASLIKNKYNIEALAHLTCLHNTKEDILEILKMLEDNGIENVLALRGDVNPNVPAKEDFKHADELTRFIKEHSAINVTGACYPEGHPQSESLVDDVLHLRAKVDAGADHLISQLFFDNRDFYSFLERAKLAGIDVPIEAGIMPVTSKKQIERIVSLCGASLPAKFSKMMTRYEDHPQALKDAGIAYAIDQIIDLIANGVDGIHLYTMNNPEVARRITEAISSLLKVESV